MYVSRVMSRVNPQCYVSLNELRSWRSMTGLEEKKKKKKEKKKEKRKTEIEEEKKRKKKKEKKYDGIRIIKKKKRFIFLHKVLSFCFTNPDHHCKKKLEQSDLSFTNPVHFFNREQKSGTI